MFSSIYLELSYIVVVYQKLDFYFQVIHNSWVSTCIWLSTKTCFDETVDKPFH